MDAAALVAALRDRGVALRPDGDQLVVRPASRAADLLDDLRQLKPEVLALLAETPARDAAPANLGRFTLTLDPTTIREMLGTDPDPRDLGCLRLDVEAAVRQLEREIAAGPIVPALRLVRGRPLADWLDLDAVAQLFRVWDRSSRPERGVR